LEGGFTLRSGRGRGQRRRSLTPLENFSLLLAAVAGGRVTFLQREHKVLLAEQVGTLPS